MLSEGVGKIDFPTLGDLIDGWIEQHCVIPQGFKRGRPFRQYDWQFWCTANHYRVREDATYDPDDPPMNQAFVYRLTQVIAPQKALALDTPIATPSGWTTMGDVRPGDLVFDEKGDPTRVLSKSQVWMSDTYRVTFSDGASLVACKDHQWWVDRRTPSGTYVEDRVRTADLVGNLTDAHGARRFRVPAARPLALPEADLPIAPYTLGAWLGDGNSDDGRITGIDEQVFALIEADGFPVTRTSIEKRRQIHGLRPLLRASGLLRNKHIPEAYLRASEKQRWALLQGLMDTDGHADARQGKCEFTTTLPALRDGMRELLYSLGIKHTCYEGRATLNGRDTGPKWRLFFAARSDMPVFGLDRKQGRLRSPGRGHEQFKHRRIVSVEKIATEPTQCLTVEAPSHVFLAGREMIPTCNTGKGPMSACWTCVAAVGPELFGGWAKRGDVYRCEDQGCDCGWYYEYEPGEPMGVRHPSPLIQLTANSQDQVKNVWGPLNTMIRRPGSPLAKLIKPLGEMMRVMAEGADPEADRIDMVTSSAKSRVGNPISDYLHDEAGLYTKQNGMIDVAEAQERGAAGMGGRGKQTTNCYDPAEESFAQVYHEGDFPDVFTYYRNPDTNPDLIGEDGKPIPYSTKTNRRKIHAYVYEGSDHVDLDSIEGIASKLAITDPAQAERFFGNRIRAGGGAWLPDGIWEARRADVAA